MTGMTMGTAVLGAVAAAGLVLGQPASTGSVTQTEIAIRGAAREADGTSWRAHTTVLLASGPVTIDEEIVLADDGTLVRAYTSVQEDGEEIRTWYEPRTALVTTTRKAGTHHEHIASDGTPWVYGPVHTAHDETIGTPLAALATRRAAQHHPRLLRVGASGSQLVPVDQLVVGTTVILGDDALDVGDEGVRSIHLHATDTTLSRAGSPDDAIVRFRTGG